VSSFPVALTGSDLIKNQPFVPADWSFLEASPGGLDFNFVNRKTNKMVLYTPEGMTAEDLMQIPRAGKYFSSKEEAEEYIKRMVAERQRDTESGYANPKVSAFLVRER
jgi:hypothetical protein